mmetsp:Transcript_33488/g.105483  ORF Transcript_33488/g.105483 Transcript_33488/m.105483 type:complete len:170 (-) Transcript_33488:463-972(-)
MGCELQANGHVDLVSVLCGLASLRMKSVMVEGGAQVIRSFLTSRLVNSVIITVAPKLAGGLSALSRPPQVETFSSSGDVKGRAGHGNKEDKGDHQREQETKSKRFSFPHPRFIRRAWQKLSCGAKQLLDRLLQQGETKADDSSNFDLLTLRDVRYVQVGVDMIVHGTLS